MSIIIATTAAEAAAVVRELDGTSTTITTTLDLPWSGLVTDSARGTAVGAPDPAVEEVSPQVGDSVDMPRAPRNRRWSRADVSDLHVWVRDGVSVAEIGERLGRSPSSVRHKIAAIEKDRAGKRLAPMRQKKVTA